MCRTSTQAGIVIQNFPVWFCFLVQLCRWCLGDPQLHSRAQPQVACARRKCVVAVVSTASSSTWQLLHRLRLVQLALALNRTPETIEINFQATALLIRLALLLGARFMDRPQVSRPAVMVFKCQDEVDTNFQVNHA